MASGIGRSGMAAIVAVAIAAGAIAYRVASDRHGDEPPPAAAIRGVGRRSRAARASRARRRRRLAEARLRAIRRRASTPRRPRPTPARPRSARANAVLWSSLGEARVMASASDPMPPAALEAFRKAIALDPKDPRARYFLAVQTRPAGRSPGRHRRLAGAAKGHARRRTVGQRPAAHDRAGRQDQQDRGRRPHRRRNRRSPHRAAGRRATTARAEPAAARRRHIASARHAAGDGRKHGRAAGAASSRPIPANVDGWVMLMRSYRTLGRDGEAKAALAEAVAANPAHAAELRSAAASLGVSL